MEVESQQDKGSFLSISKKLFYDMACFWEKRVNLSRPAIMDKIHSILLVDDDPIANFTHEDLLTSVNISDEISIATNGQEALDLVQKSCYTGNCPQLILLDLNMPIMDGFEFINGYKTMHLNKAHGVTIVILSSSANSRDVERAQAMDVSDYIVKPLTEKKIKDRIEGYFRSKTK